MKDRYYLAVALLCIFLAGCDVRIKNHYYDCSKIGDISDKLNECVKAVANDSYNPSVILTSCKKAIQELNCELVKLE